MDSLNEDTFFPNNLQIIFFSDSDLRTKESFSELSFSIVSYAFLRVVVLLVSYDLSNGIRTVSDLALLLFEVILSLPSVICSRFCCSVYNVFEPLCLQLATFTSALKV